MSTTTTVAITGANGRMGNELLHACSEDNHVNLVAALVRADHSLLGNEIQITSSLTTEPVQYTSQDEPCLLRTDVLIDFTLPDNTMAVIQHCINSNTAIVIGTTGFTDKQQLCISAAAKQIPVLQASNMSIGVNVTMALLRQASRILGSEIPVDITETHHVHKKDSPSGTAITMAETIAETGNRDLNERMVVDANEQNYQPGMIYVNSIREGEVVGDHCVSFLLENEKIEISHKAGDRKIFAQGAVKAARWLSGKKPGKYSIDDVLGI